MKLELLKIRKDKIRQFNKKGIYNIEDLLNFIPRKYYDFTTPTMISDLKDGEYQAVVGIISEITNNKGIIKIKVEDKSSKTMSVTFFNQSYLNKILKKGDVYLIAGMVKKFYGHNVMTNPTLFTKDVKSNLKIHPVYSAIAGMSNSYLNQTINTSLNLINKDDYLENILLKKYDLPLKYEAIIKLHQPKSLKDIEEGKKRLLFDDLFFFNFKLRENKTNTNKHTEIEIKKFDKAKIAMDNLPFHLTKGQSTVLRDISKKMVSKQRVNALVQGDVGSGKTLVAFLLMITVCENGYQSCLVAPTNILATQHYKDLKEIAEPLGFKIGFLTSNLKTKEKKSILKQIENGEIDMVVGTHSLMNSAIKYSNLGISIIDEEHRFGVEQRDSLNIYNAHTISMSATPIPRSLALSIYGDDIDVETINTLPEGRKDIITDVVDSDDIAYKRMLKEVKNGRQGYIICPLIDKSESEKMNDVCDLKTEFNKAQKYFGKYGFKVGLIEGKMKEDEVSQEIQLFKEKKYDILLSTTIIEVGVNVPNATTIVIKNAERFGFAQLHQLRGRVGRSKLQSYCFLITTNKEKFEIFTKTKDGFEIAKADLELRGAGSFLGTQQSGSNKYLMLMLEYPKLNESIKKDINEIFADNKRLNRYFVFLQGEDINE